MNILARPASAVISVIVLLAATVAVAKDLAETTRPAAWAVPVTIAGAPNLHRVTPTFYRSAQPDAAGFAALAKDPGIKTVVSLRAFNSDQPLARGTGIALVRIKIHTWHIETEDIVAALAALRIAEAAGPVLLHCQHGADRTGLVSALYRVLYQGWTKDAALDEMLHGQFGYHAVWGNIPRYLRTVDRVALRQRVDAAAAQAAPQIKKASPLAGSLQ